MEEVLSDLFIIIILQGGCVGDDTARAAAGAVLIDGSCFPGQQAVLETRAGVQGPGALTSLLCDLGHMRHCLQVDWVTSKDSFHL